MLAKQDLKLTYMIFSMYSTMNFLPFKIDTKTFQWTNQTSTVRLYIWKLNIFFGLNYYGLLNFNLIRSILSTELLSYSYFPLYFGNGMGMVFLITSYHTHMTRGQSTSIVANEIRDISCGE